ncbi:MAG: hypothetical protein WBO73_10755 [Gammaproteobacteria bacterium]
MISAVVLLSQHCSDADTAKRFDDLGFASESVAPNAMLISAEASHFRDVFKVELEQSKNEGVYFIVDDHRTRSLPLEKVPQILQSCISAIEFEAPISFGPPDY